MITLEFNQIILIFGCLIGIVLINPIGDAIRDNGKKQLQKRIELIRDLLFFIILYIVTNNFTFTLCTGVSYWCLRISLHNIAYNLTRKLPWYFTGTTSGSDKVEGKLIDKGFKNYLIIARIFTFLFGMLIFWIGIM